MASLENVESQEAFVARLRVMDESELIGNKLVQQGAVHAIAFLMKHGVTEANAAQILADLRQNYRLLRDEAARRGKPDLFPNDQTGFT